LPTPILIKTARYREVAIDDGAEAMLQNASITAAVDLSAEEASYENAFIRVRVASGVASTTLGSNFSANPAKRLLLRP
jgi:hypothetical protein